MLFDCVYDLSVTIYFIAILLNKNRWEIQKYKQMTFESYKFSHDSMILSVMQCNHAIQRTFLNSHKYWNMLKFNMFLIF